MSASKIVITGLGMHTAVGSCAEQTCAAVRAGVNRFVKWPWYTPDTGSSDEEDEGPAGITAAAIEPDLGDRSWIEKTLALVQQPFLEALWHAGLHGQSASDSPTTTRVYVATPYLDRESSSVDVGEELADIDDPEASDADDEAAEDHAEDDGPSRRNPPGFDQLSPGYQRFIRLLEQLVAETLVATVKFFPNDHAAGAAAIADAQRELESGQTNLAIVIGLDSLLDTGHLDYLLETGYLKTATNPTGAIPGEGATVLVLETATQAVQRGANPLAVIGPVRAAMEAYWIGDDQPITGQSLGHVLLQAADAAGGASQISHIMIDLNGQRARFIEWATVETRCMHKFPRGWRLDHPADCLGDLGAAFVPTAVGLIARGMHRGYQALPTLICCSSLRGERAALSVSPWKA